MPPYSRAVVASACANSSNRRPKLLLGDPDPGVGDSEVDPVLAVLMYRRDAQGYVSILGELAGVAEQVEEDLAQPHAVGVNRADRRRTIKHQFIVVLLRERPCSIQRLVDDRPDRHRLKGQIHFPGFDLGDIEDVVDQIEQVTAGAQHPAQRLVRLLGAEPGGVVA